MQKLTLIYAAKPLFVVRSC